MASLNSRQCSFWFSSSYLYLCRRLCSCYLLAVLFMFLGYLGPALSLFGICVKSSNRQALLITKVGNLIFRNLQAPLSFASGLVRIAVRAEASCLNLIRAYLVPCISHCSSY
jgi:hypothetical protein